MLNNFAKKREVIEKEQISEFNIMVNKLHREDERKKKIKSTKEVQRIDEILRKFTTH
jgi:hypothetical protein